MNIPITWKTVICEFQQHEKFVNLQNARIPKICKYRQLKTAQENWRYETFA